MNSAIHPLALLNTSIITVDGSYECRTITLKEARELILDVARDQAHCGWASYVGHQSTALIMSTLLGHEVAVCRDQFAQRAGQTALVLKLRGRPQEGVILSAAEVVAVGYDFKLLVRTA